jgi:hypothetical protein
MIKKINMPDRKIIYIACAVGFLSTDYLVTQHAKASYRGGYLDMKGDPAIVVGVWIGVISVSILLYYINSVRRYRFDVKYLSLVGAEYVLVLLISIMLSIAVSIQYVIMLVIVTVVLFWYERKYFIKYYSL